MLEHCCPLVTCRLTDQYGNPINPYEPDSIVYTVLVLLRHRDKCGCCPEPNNLQVAIEGYVAVYSEEKRISPPIPFCIIESLCLSTPKGSILTFQLESFHCWAASDLCEDDSKMERIKLLISMETIVFSKLAVTLQVPQVDSCFNVIDRICIRAGQICDSVRFRSGCCICYKNTVLKADISQYSTIADGAKRTYLNSDEMKEYGNKGILSPQEVSYYDVFVNAMLQPRANYILRKGELTFTTQNIPSKGQAVMVLFTTLKNIDGKIMDVTDWHYNACSNGEKKVYTDDDELIEYGDHGIPSPCDVSYFNLYINGVLQPKVNYQVRKGVLQLNTIDAPVKGALVILESIVIRDSEGQLFRVETYAYNARSNGGNIYTSQNEIRMYGNQGVLDPDESFYQNLFVNGVLQPNVNYMVQTGYLILKTEDSPTVRAPISLQFVKNSPAPFCRKVRMSDAALAQWKKEYAYIKKPCLPAQPLEGPKKAVK